MNMKKSETQINPYGDDILPVFVWQEGDQLVTQLDGIIVRGNNCFQIDSKLDAITLLPRCLYFVDKPHYEVDV